LTFVARHCTDMVPACANAVESNRDNLDSDSDEKWYRERASGRVRLALLWVTPVEGAPEYHDG